MIEITPEQEAAAEAKWREENEKDIWLRFAEAALTGTVGADATLSDVMVRDACDFADAMLEEAKKRGRV